MSRYPYFGCVPVTEAVEDRAIRLLEQRGWQLKTVAGVCNVEQNALRLALAQRFGRARVERLFRKRRIS